MPTTLQTYALNMLQPMQRPEDARQDALRFAASLTITKGQAIGVKTSTGLAQQLVPGATDGTQNFVGFSMYDFLTDASQNVFYSDSTTAAWFNTGLQVAPVWIAGIFDPADLKTKATPVAQVDTYTAAGTVTVGDIYTIQHTAPDGTITSVSYTALTSPTASTVAAGLIAAWNANATLAAVATASGTATTVLTGVTAGTPFVTVNPAGTASTGAGVGTFTRVATTAASGRALADVLVGCPGARLLHNGFWKI